MPNAKPISDLSHKDRRALYEEQVRIAWEDGVLGPKERRILGATRDRLGLRLEEASSIEDDVLANIHPMT